jgi:hypothetical protein
VVAVASPLDIAGCVGWWDASDASTLFAADTGTTLATTTVGRWADKSTAAIDLIQPTSGSRPTAAAAAVNGRSALTFDGTDFLSAATSVALGDNTVIMVVREDVAVNYAGLFAYYPATGNDNANANGWVADLQLSDNIISLNSGAFSLNWTGVSTLPISVVTLRRQIAAGDRQMIRSNGITQAVNASASTGTAAGILIGGRFQSGAVDTLYRARITLCEVVRWDRALSAAEYASVESYLAAKWGISGVHAPATASSDPVGYWADKSGNGRHAVQATAGSRGAISATSQGSRKALAFDATTKNLVSPATVAQYVADATTSPKVFFAFVARPEGGGALIAYGSPTNPNTASRIFYCSDFGSAGSHIVDFGAIPGARLTGVVGNEAENVGHVYSAFRDGAIMSIRRDGVEILRKTDCTGVYSDTSGTLAINTAQGAGGTASWCEFLTYAASMPAANITRIERYLAARWGITLAPQVSNADAQDWINRVYSNGGTVSTATANAVNQFCTDIENAPGGSLRDRFYRLNLFCGNSDASLAAVRTPLFRGPSLGGTQYGNTTDDNNNFVAPDYNEASGLRGDGSTKYLNTGVPMNFTNIRDYHLSSYVSSVTSGNPGFIGADTNGDGVSPRFFQALVSFVSTPRIWVWYNYGTTGSQSDNSSNSYTPGLLSGVGSATANNLYVGASSVGSAVAQPNETASRTFPIYVFAYNNRNAVVSSYANARLGGYSLGLAMTATQVGQYNTALAAFNSAMGRA